MTIEKLIRDGVVNGRDSKHGKYELKRQTIKREGS